jgi:tetratricopeptide (TPR) repeat protein
MFSEYAGDLARAGHRAEALRVHRRAADCARGWREDLPSRQDHILLAVLLRNLGDSLNRRKEPAAAEGVLRACLGLREALEREKALSVPAEMDFVHVRRALAEALHAQCRAETAREEAKLLDEAIAACRQIVRRTKGHAEVQSLLAQLLLEKGERDEALAAYREALRLPGDRDAAYHGLGLLLAEQGRLDEVVALYREAVRLNPTVRLCHTWLGLALQGQGHFREAAAELRLGRRDVRDPAPPYAQQWCLVLIMDQAGAGPPDVAAPWLRVVERLAETEPRLPALLAGTAPPADAVERLALALVWHQDRQLFAAAAGQYAAAFAAEPALAEGPSSGHRYWAAQAAARAGCGQGKDAAGLDGPGRAALRRQALSWLRADVAEWRRLLEAEPVQGRPAVLRSMAYWLQDRAFAGVRGPDALARLPEAERRDWQRLWEEVEALSDWQRLWERGSRH